MASNLECISHGTSRHQYRELRKMTRKQWTEMDDRVVKVSRALAMDAVQKVGNGHPGTAMALAPVAYTIFQRFLRHDPSDPQWLGRDRFVLSPGHSSLTLYTQLFRIIPYLQLIDSRAPRVRTYSWRRDHNRSTWFWCCQRCWNGNGR
jgi:hypothetical protein